ncbi:MAG: low molecular weight phosphotyrosine protein phosphatase [Planctomycetes bacterium]|nr:low molecular weight phosphotyrosine protein phosphatase [Planctomycetota bacterium]
MGNICRSPTAEGVFREFVRRAGMVGRIETDSCGTISFHSGSPPDPRAQAAARQRGYDLSDLRARALSPDDFERFDYVLAMDAENLRYLEEHCADRHRDRIRLFLDFAGPTVEEFEVPDPYYGGDAGFERVLDLIEAGARGLLEHIRSNQP